MWHPCFCNIQCSVAGRGDTSHVEYKEDESAMKDAAKDKWKGAMGLQLMNGTVKDDTNVTKADVHKPTQRDSPDADPSKEKELLCNEYRGSKIIVDSHRARR